MGMLAFLKRPKVQEPFTETTFECKRGTHGFGKKHDAIAMAHLRRFAGGIGNEEN